MHKNKEKVKRVMARSIHNGEVTKEEEEEEETAEQKTTGSDMSGCDASGPR